MPLLSGRREPRGDFLLCTKELDNNETGMEDDPEIHAYQDVTGRHIGKRLKSTGHAKHLRSRTSSDDCRKIRSQNIHA